MLREVLQRKRKELELGLVTCVFLSVVDFRFVWSLEWCDGSLLKILLCPFQLFKFSEFMPSFTFFACLLLLVVWDDNSIFPRSLHLPMIMIYHNWIPFWSKSFINGGTVWSQWASTRMTVKELVGFLRQVIDIMRRVDTVSGRRSTVVRMISSMSVPSPILMYNRLDLCLKSSTFH